MNGWILLGIGIASLAIIAFACAYLGLKGWRLAKHAIHVSRHVAPLAAELAGRTDEAGRAAGRLSADGADLTADLERMQRSLRRLKILTDAWDGAMAPLVRIAEYVGT